MRAARALRDTALLALVAAVITTGLSACSTTLSGPPRCNSLERVGLVAQTVPAAAYVPCIATLPQGWRDGSFTARPGLTQFRLLSDRSGGHPIDVRFQAQCDVRGASPMQPRTAGGRTYLWLRSIEPRYAGTITDVFPGGCVRYTFDLQRGPHIGVLADLGDIVSLQPRRQLSVALRRELGIEMNG